MDNLYLGEDSSLGRLWFIFDLYLNYYIFMDNLYLGEEANIHFWFISWLDFVLWTTTTQVKGAIISHLIYILIRFLIFNGQP